MMRSNDKADEMQTAYDLKEATMNALKKKLSAIIGWLEANQPDVFKRGLLDAIGETKPDNHDSDCATHNMPAMPNGRCNCKLKRESFKQAAEPMVKWLKEHGNPHSLVTIELDGAMLYSGEIGQPFEVQD